jgi:hypothetical protein
MPASTQFWWKRHYMQIREKQKIWHGYPAKNVPYIASQTCVELPWLFKMNKPQKCCELDATAMQHGHMVVWLKRYHCHCTLLKPYKHSWVITGIQATPSRWLMWRSSHVSVFVNFVWCLYHEVRTVSLSIIQINFHVSRVKTRKARISAIALYGCETWSLTLRE